ncbi:MAG: ADP-ribosylglycohydrolase family protein [Verrucomicrobia bacterium]|nr:ADP-ribosylglycohydrolase family protein [Verrucomicrobiota bacterium]
MDIAGQNRFRGCLLGLAVGDAVGTTVEFKPRGSFPPVTDMTGGGPFSLDPGQWTDDTSLALCLAESLIAKGGFDAQDQMERYVRWYKDGHLSSTGTCFDIGNTTSSSLHRFQSTGDPYAGSADARSAGNGSIMRLAPVPMFFYPDTEKAIHYAGESSRTTHGTRECIDACRLFALLQVKALSGDVKESILFDYDAIMSLDLTENIHSVACGEYTEKTEDEVRGSGYVVESLEAALWCFHTTSTFRDAILKAVNLGDDADTTAAVCGQIAGAHYEESGIPGEWLGRLAVKDLIVESAAALHAYV